MGRGIYVERVIWADVERVWGLTQDPELHERWDARFGMIEYLPRGEGEPQRFRYGWRVLPGVVVSGTGVSAGEAWRPDGTRTSALRFGSTHRLSPIVSGSGYWRYVPVAGGVRFLTGYDYVPRYGRPLDALFRPLMGWATAWSFDRLRLWAERGVTPEASLRRAWLELGVRATVTAVGAWAIHRLGPTGTTGRLAVAASPGYVGAGRAGHAAGWRAVPGPADSAPRGVRASGGRAGWAVAAGMGVLLALFTPPLPGTPAARRCRRRPPDRVAGTAPRILAALPAGQGA